MTAPKSVEAFGQPMLDLFDAASETKVTLTFANKGAAISFRHKVYRCRTALRRENHFMLVKAELCVVREPRLVNGEWELVIEPAAVQDADIIGQALAAAGVTPRSKQELPEKGSLDKLIHDGPEEPMGQLPYGEYFDR